VHQIDFLHIASSTRLSGWSAVNNSTFPPGVSWYLKLQFADPQAGPWRPSLDEDRGEGGHDEDAPKGPNEASSLRNQSAG
jgi:hypothetical protein